MLLTVDCGFSEADGAEVAKSLGVDAVITDHHVVSSPPPYPFAALVNPHRPDSEYPFPDLTGVGAAYKLAQALYEALDREEPLELLELVALGTIGDVGPLTGENRYFVAEGIRQMNVNRSTGIAALADVAGLGESELDAQALSFQIIPRLNAPATPRRRRHKPRVAYDDQPPPRADARQNDRRHQHRAQRAHRRRRQ